MNEAAKWIEKATGQTPSEFGQKVALMLDAWKGVHNVSGVLRADWTNERWIEFTYQGDLSTFDGTSLTTLVFLAHEMCIRLEISPASPRLLRLKFHPRQREGGIYQRHPTLEQAVERFHTHHRKEMPTTEREALGRLVRHVWVDYCQKTGRVEKPHHVDPWERLDDWDKEVDRRIGEAVARFVRGGMQ